mgnify:CR=1 FL=1
MGKCSVLNKVKTRLEENDVDLDMLKSFEKEIIEVMITYSNFPYHFYS